MTVDQLTNFWALFLKVQLFYWMLLHKKLHIADILPKGADNAEKIFGPDIPYMVKPYYVGN